MNGNKELDDFLQKDFITQKQITLRDAFLFKFPNLKSEHITFNDDGLQIDTVSGITKEQIDIFLIELRIKEL